MRVDKNVILECNWNVVDQSLASKNILPEAANGYLSGEAVETQNELCCKSLFLDCDVISK